MLQLGLDALTDLVTLPASPVEGQHVLDLALAVELQGLQL